MTLDTLTLARRLKSAGFSEQQAEALADVNRDMLADDVATKADIQGLARDNAQQSKDLRAEIGQTRSDLQVEIGLLRKELHAEIGLLRTELHTEIGLLRNEMHTEIDKVNGKIDKLNDKVDQTQKCLQASIETAALKVTIRLGVMIGGATAILAAVLRLH